MPHSASLKVATYNVNGIRPRLPALLEWLGREQPDIACLQELKAPGEAFPVEDIHDAGYGALWQGQRSWNGVAILSRGAQPAERRRALPGDDSDVQSRYLEAEVHGLVVGCLYLPNGNPQPGPKFEHKLAWFERLIEHASSLLASGEPTVLAGDFNVVPTDEDIYNPRSWRKDALLQPETRACYARLLAQGWTDALRAAHPDERIYTFWDYFRDHWPRNAGLRIDHLLLSDGLAERLLDAGVDRWVRDRPSPSDHAPTWVRLGVAPSSASARKADTPSSRKRAPPKPDRATSDTPPSTERRAGRKTVAKKTASRTRVAREPASNTRGAAKTAPPRQAASKRAAIKRASKTASTAASTPAAKKAVKKSAGKRTTPVRAPTTKPAVAKRR